jgi:hypothetical protein
MPTSTNPVTPPNLIDQIRELVAACGPTANRNDQAIVAIALCIAEGVDTRNHIVKSLTRAGFHRGHAGATLDGNCGRRPESGHWRLGADGRYALHEEVPA